MCIRDSTVNGNLVLDPFIDVKEKDDIRLDNKKIKNHIGIVLDDLVAGLYAAFTVWLILILF